jgi:hypothetical protein
MLGPPIHLRLAALIGIAFLDHNALTPPVRREQVGLPAVLSERESAKQTLARLFPAPLVVIPDVDPTTGKCVGWDYKGDAMLGALLGRVPASAKGWRYISPPDDPNLTQPELLHFCTDSVGGSWITRWVGRRVSRDFNY